MLATAQYGLFTHQQATAVGFTRGAISRRVRSGIWERSLPRVFRLAGMPTRGRQAALAACLWAGADAVVSHETAAVLWGLEGIRTRRVHVTMPATQRPISSLVEVHRGEVDEALKT